MGEPPPSVEPWVLGQLRRLIDETAALRSQNKSLHDQNQVIITEVTRLRELVPQLEARVAELEARGVAASAGGPTGAGSTEPRHGGAAALPLPAPAEAPSPQAQPQAAVAPPLPVPQREPPDPTRAAPPGSPAAGGPEPPRPQELPAADTWALDSGRLAMYENAFRSVDRDADGIVSALEVKEVLDRTGLPDETMREIYFLVDVEKRGRLFFGEFAAAMYVAFRRAKQGVAVPDRLPPELVASLLAQLSQSQVPKAFLEMCPRLPASGPPTAADGPEGDAFAKLI